MTSVATAASFVVGGLVSTLRNLTGESPTHRPQDAIRLPIPTSTTNTLLTLAQRRDLEFEADTFGYCFAKLAFPAREGEEGAAIPGFSLSDAEGAFDLMDEDERKANPQTDVEEGPGHLLKLYPATAARRRHLREFVGAGSADACSNTLHAALVIAAGSRVEIPPPRGDSDAADDDAAAAAAARLVLRDLSPEPFFPRSDSFPYISVSALKPEANRFLSFVLVGLFLQAALVCAGLLACRAIAGFEGAQDPQPHKERLLEARHGRNVIARVLLPLAFEPFTPAAAGFWRLRDGGAWVLLGDAATNFAGLAVFLIDFMLFFLPEADTIVDSVDWSAGGVFIPALKLVSLAIGVYIIVSLLSLPSEWALQLAAAVQQQQAGGEDAAGDNADTAARGGAGGWGAGSNERGDNYHGNSPARDDETQVAKTGRAQTATQARRRATSAALPPTDAERSKPAKKKKDGKQRTSSRPRSPSPSSSSR